MKAGWEIKRLPEIAEYFIGLTYSPKDVSAKGTVVLRSSNIQNDEIDLSDLVRVERSVKEALKVRDGDILMCSRNGSKRLVGKTAVISNLPEEMTFGTFMMVIRSEQNPYLAWFFKSDAFRQQLGVGENTMINQVTKYMLDAIRVPLPSFAEQQRIVGILDDAFDAIATAKANAEQNLQNTRALFESHLQSVFTQRGDGWVKTRMDAIYRVGSSKRVLKSEWKSEGVPFYRGREVTRLAADGFVDNELFISEAHFAELSKEYGVPKAGDIVITAIGTIGNSHIVRSSDRFYFKDASVLWMKRTAEVSSEFIKFWLKSSLFFDQLDRGNGATVDTLRIQKLQSVELFLPPTEEQLRIVAQLNALSEETQRLASLYQRKLAALDELKKSLLHRAFSGAL